MGVWNDGVVRALAALRLNGLEQEATEITQILARADTLRRCAEPIRLPIGEKDYEAATDDEWAFLLACESYDAVRNRK